MFEKRNCIFNGEHLEQRFIDVGFVDIKVIKKVVELGNWRGGLFIQCSTINTLRAEPSPRSMPSETCLLRLDSGSFIAI